MTTATTTRNSNTVGFKVMKWQAVEKMATEMGVTYYTESDRYRRNGYGILATGLNRGFGDQTRIEIITDAPLAPREYEFINFRIGRMATENFMMKLELWALKNNIKYLVTETRGGAYIQLIEG